MSPQALQHHRQKINSTKDGPPAQGIVPSPLNPLEYCTPPAHRCRELHPKAPPNMFQQGVTRGEEFPRPFDLKSKERAETIIHDPSLEIIFSISKSLKIFKRDVDASPPEIRRHILPEICQLKCSADRIGEWQCLRCDRTENMEHDSSYRIRGIRAVAQQFIERRIPGLKDVHAERAQERLQGILRKSCGTDGRSQGDEHCMFSASGITGVQLFFPVVQETQALLGRKSPFVGKVVSSSGERVHRDNALSVRAGNEERCHGEVLIVLPRYPFT
jgi:hypothetical protein